MGIRVSYPEEVQLKAVVCGLPVKQVMEELTIRNYMQLKK